MQIPPLSFIRHHLRGPLYRLLMLSLVLGVILSANSRAMMSWQMALPDAVSHTGLPYITSAPAAVSDTASQPVAVVHAAKSGSACHQMTSTGGGLSSGLPVPECDASCPCCFGACSPLAIMLDMPRAIRSKQQSFSRYTPRPAAAVVLALPQRPPIFS